MRKTILLFVVLLTIKLILQHFLINPAYDLQRDEYLHLDQGKHLAWGYISVPPLTSWISWLINLFGSSVFWVKFFPALFGTLTILIVWKIIEELNGKMFACFLGGIALLLSVLLRLNILYQPNSSDVFFWTLIYFSIIKYVNTKSARWLYITGLAVGFGFLSKYNIVFLVIGLSGGLALTRERRLFLERKLYIAALIALLIVMPNLVWQIQNHFPTLHQLGDLASTQLVNVNRADFVKDQVLFFVNSIFIVAAAFAGFLWYEPFKKYRFIVFSYFIAIGLYLLLKAKSYYAIGLYPVLIAFGSVYIEQLTYRGWKRLLRPLSLLFIAGFFVPLLLLAFPLKSPSEIKRKNATYKALGLLRWEDGKDHDLPQDFADMVGWSELAYKVDSVYSQLADKEHTLVLCDNYGEAGAINYYSKFRNINAVTMNADYIDWIPLQRATKNVVLVQESSDDDPGRTRERPWFEKIMMTGMIENPYSREMGTKIYQLQGAKTDINAILEEEIEKHKRH